MGGPFKSPMDPDARDRELLRSYAENGDERSLAEFIKRHESALLRFSARLLGDGHAAQDIVQEVFFRVVARPQLLLKARNCRNWLLVVTRNLGVSYMRREIRRRRNTERLSGRLARTRSFEPPADRQLERSEIREQVLRALMLLKPRHRELVLLRLQEGKSYREIGRITGLSVSNVGYLLHCALKELSVLLRDIREVLE